jgi:hypothetical protein
LSISFHSEAVIERQSALRASTSRGSFASFRLADREVAAQAPKLGPRGNL